MDYRVQIFQLEDYSWAVWYKDNDGNVIEKYGLNGLKACIEYLQAEKAYPKGDS